MTAKTRSILLVVTTCLLVKTENYVVNNYDEYDTYI